MSAWILPVVAILVLAVWGLRVAHSDRSFFVASRTAGALLAGLAFRESGWQMDLDASLDVEDLPAWVCGDGDERQRFYTEHWDTWRWRAIFRVFFGQTLMKRLGRDPSFFKHVEVDRIGDRFRLRLRFGQRVDQDRMPLAGRQGGDAQQIPLLATRTRCQRCRIGAGGHFVHLSRVHTYVFGETTIEIDTDQLE